MSSDGKMESEDEIISVKYIPKFLFCGRYFSLRISFVHECTRGLVLIYVVLTDLP